MDISYPKRAPEEEQAWRWKGALAFATILWALVDGLFGPLSEHLRSCFPDAACFYWSGWSSPIFPVLLLAAPFVDGALLLVFLLNRKRIRQNRPLIVIGTVLLMLVCVDSLSLLGFISWGSSLPEMP